MIAQHLIFLQVPTHVPGHESDPVVFSFTNILIFIVLPVALFIFYIWWERKKAIERNEKQKHKIQESADKKGEAQKDLDKD